MRCSVKHGFFALALDACGCGCQNPNAGGTLLGVGCSDPYTANRNGSQAGNGGTSGGLGPRFEVNAHTGFFLYPYTDQGVSGNSIYKRVQARLSNVDPAQNVGALYFVEGQYVTPDDAAAGNQNNNVSYRRVTITGNSSNTDATLADVTMREKAAIHAWVDNDPMVTVIDADVPGEGRFHLGFKVTDLGGGTWHYEYALHNMNSDRSAQSFTVPIGTNATLTNIGFHDVDYHSGEPYSLTDWTASQSGGTITWSTETETQNVNANALRWGTMYNFRFDADAPPMSANATIGLFKAGTPASFSVAATGPEGMASGIPAASDWGMLVIALLMGVTGTVVFARSGQPNSSKAH